LKAVIVTIGDEILTGHIVDTNAAWLAARLSEIGFEVIKKISIGDDREAIMATLKEMTGVTSLVLITGGLGPTPDDVTRKALFDFFESTPVEDPAVLRQVQSFMEKRGRPLTDLNRKQALVAHNCKVIPNNIGTAPGMWFEKRGTIFVAMPGVPFEMQEMFNSYLQGMLKEHFALPSFIVRQVLLTGIGESFLAEEIKQWEKNLPPSIHLSYLPSPGMITLRLTARDENRDALEQEVESQLRKLQTLIPSYIYGYDNDTLEAVVGRMLWEHGKTLSLAESCTGGAIGRMIVNVPGASRYFKGGVIAYSNEIKINVLGVPESVLGNFGAVSRETVCAMAEGVRKLFDTDYAVAVSGIAGPEGGTEEKPVGTVWIAVTSKEETTAEKFSFGDDDRQRNITKSAIAALNLLRKSIQII